MIADCDCFCCGSFDGRDTGQRGRADRAARYGLVPCRRAAGRDFRQAGQGGDVHARRRAAKVDPNGTYQVEQMYVQYFLPANEKGAYPLSDVARRRPHRRDVRDDAGRTRGLAELFPAQGLGRLQFRRGRARPRRLGAIPRHLQERAGVPHDSQPVRALSHRRRRGLLRSRSGQAQADAGQPVSERGLREFRQAERAALDHDR